MTKQTEQIEQHDETTTETVEQPRKSTAGIVVRAVALGLLAGTVGMTTACCQGAAGAGEGEGE